MFYDYLLSYEDVIESSDELITLLGCQFKSNFGPAKAGDHYYLVEFDLVAGEVNLYVEDGEHKTHNFSFGLVALD